ncbi:methyltransferase, partial [Acinetobacter baumannii]|nr:methyltransferase [Acinetobacter baumannii]
MPNTIFLQRVADLYDTFKQHDSQQSDRLQRYRNIEVESAQLISQLIRMQQAKSILEIGTSTGYSTLWLAEAAQATGGQVITVEIDAKRSA